MAFLHNNTNAEHNMSCPPKYKCDDTILNYKNDSKKYDSLLYYANEVLAAMHNAYNFFTKHYYLLVMIIITIFVVYLVYKIYWDPICYVKELTEVGFEHIPPGPDRQGRLVRAQAARRLGTKIPPPYPNGWFAIAEARDLKMGGVMAVDALGQNLCVYRGEDGKARVVDAYCPHLGAHLGIGGTVCGNCIECPFHKWKFDAEGRCVEVPGVEQAPKGVSIKSWWCVEADGAVWVWHDAERRAPLWPLTDAPECAHWPYRGRNEFIVSAHIQEIPENGADVAHLNAVHAPSLLSGLGEKYPYLSEIIGRHVWSGSWTSNGDHTASMSLSHHYQIFNWEFFHTELTITQNGPGHVRLLMRTPLGPFLFSQSVTPLAPLLQRVTHRLYSPGINAPAAWPLILSEGKMIERDIRIWNSKRFVSAPTYVKTDRTIRAFRSWYAQFYTDHSVSFRDAMQNPLDW